MLTETRVPGNRWDLLDVAAAPRPRVSVIVAHYEQPAQLRQTWAALCRQTLPPSDVVIADDGSAVPPAVPFGGPPVRVVTQPDRGFRAAAARNLGVRHTRGEVLVFLDADTVPEPGFVEAITRRAALCPDVLAVGRRRHADLADLAPGGDPSTAPRLEEPAWLRDAYAGSRDLLDADSRSFRFVISAVLACRRSLFDDLGGFDERFVGYGGEDWDLAYRAWNAGAVFVHEPSAVAWHDGPDWAGRAEDRRARKDLESARLAALIPEPSTRGVALPGRLPDVLADVEPGLGFPDAVRVVHSLLAQNHRDLRVRLPEPVEPALAQLYAGVAQTEPWSADQLARARARLRCAAPLPPDAVAAAVAELVDRDLGDVHLCDQGRRLAAATATRAVGRARRWGGSAGEMFGADTLEVRSPATRDDLAGYFTAAAKR